MARLMGIPTADIAQFGRWSTDLGLLFSFPVAPHRPVVEDALRGLMAYAAELIEQRRSSPGDDLISLMIAAEEDGDRLSAADLQWQVVNLTFAGHDTTRNQLAFILAMFAEHPDAWRDLAADPSLGANAVGGGPPAQPGDPRHHADDRRRARLRRRAVPAGDVRDPAGRHRQPRPADVPRPRAARPAPAQRPPAAHLRGRGAPLPRRQPGPGRDAGGAAPARPRPARPGPRRAGSGGRPPRCCWGPTRCR